MKSADGEISAESPQGRNILAQCVSPGFRAPSPRLRHPSPARAGEGKGRGRVLQTHGSRRGLSDAAPTELDSVLTYACEVPLGSAYMAASAVYAIYEARIRRKTRDVCATHGNGSSAN